MTSETAKLLRQMNADKARENIAWWESQRDEHIAKCQYIAAQKCQEEIDLWQQELEDLP